MIPMPIESLIDKCKRPPPRADVSIWWGPELSLRDPTKLALLEVSGSHEWIVEIGSWLGYSTTLLAEHNPGTVIAVDTWLGSVDLHSTDKMRPIIERSYDQFNRNTYELRDRIWALRMDSIAGMGLIWECGVKPTLVFIDAGHEYESAWADIHMARRMWPEAMIVADDMDHPGVGMAVRELIPGGKEIMEIGYIWRP